MWKLLVGEEKGTGYVDKAIVITECVELSRRWVTRKYVKSLWTSCIRAFLASLHVPSSISYICRADWSELGIFSPLFSVAD